MSQRITVRAGGVSLRFHARSAAVTTALFVAMLAGLVASVAVGEFAIPPADVVNTLVGAGDQATNFVVLDLRLPRALTGLLVGAALGVAGAIFQDVTRNPLASPDVVGIASGGSLAAVALIVFTEVEAVPLAALAGSLTAGALLYVLAWRGGVQGFRLVLVGIGVAAFANAGISYVLTRGRIFEVETAYVWLVGSLNGRSWDQVWPLAVGVGVLVPVILALSRRVAVLGLGDDVARSLGVGVERSRLLLLGAAVLLTGLAVSAAGMVSFVAFVAPHIARRLTRSTSMLAAAGCGAVLVLSADLIGRTLSPPTEIPVGILTSIIAAPYFLLLLRRARA
ncbi:iron chelate uptake ABC transporter family permease subunit [Solirubrobacter phytolaccae]|uniref:Iron chelate uptake ABC transporter family permease subunit n=1 Tax=Solirubrobacter phytolaccae TaxID=1404360 RepID=A0A9X3N903_9ACTN|nr:iron chelate uptake ABC transporter family permease subunit [Solirubrobacter phytolaccae]MDA0180472.1 iron chelate uptake ABC transporter family permease subunit [Solirubrobacter phytolaccae]